MTSDPDVVRRQTLARSSWVNQRWIDVPVLDTDLPRLWQEEGHSFPYLRDVFNAGCGNKPDNAICCYTNADIIVRTDATIQIASALQHTDAAYAYRMDFHHRLRLLPKDSQFSTASIYPGSDLVVFRVGWWNKHKWRMPDMLIGQEAWDPVIRTLIDEINHGGKNEIVGICCHERHNSYWESKNNRYRLRGQLHNIELAKQFFRQRGIDHRQFGLPA